MFATKKWPKCLYPILIKGLELKRKVSFGIHVFYGVQTGGSWASFKAWGEGGVWTFCKVKKTDGYSNHYLKFEIIYIYITRNSWRKGSFLTTIDGNLKSSYQLPRSFGSLIGILLDGYFMQFLTSRVVQECTGLIYQRSHSQVWFLRTGVHKHVPNGRSESSICTGFSFWMGIIFVCVCVWFWYPARRLVDGMLTRLLANLLPYVCTRRCGECMLLEWVYFIWRCIA